MIQRLIFLFACSLLAACVSNTSPAPVQTSEAAAVRGAPGRAPMPTDPAPAPRTEAPTSTPSPAPAPAPGPTSIPAPVPPASTASSPAASLLVSVDTALAAGDLEGAAATAERALRISPRDAYLWYRLAAIRYQQQRYADADGVARRALSFAGQDRELSRDINTLLSAITNAR